MSVDQLISEVLGSIRNHWYADRPREFKRDERALMKAIMRYGYECNNRGWQFDVPFIFSQLMTLLKEIRTKDAQIKYLPVYLDGAVQRWLGQKAEELSAKAKVQRTPGKLAAAIIDSGKVVAVVREKTAVETCAEVFQALHRKAKAQRKAAKATPKAVQPSLL